MATYTPTSSSGTNYTSKLKTNDIIQANYTGNQVPVTLPTGSYQLECWGAQGGDGQFADYSQYRYCTISSSDITVQTYTYGGYRAQATYTMDGHESTMFLGSVGYYDSADHGGSVTGNARSIPNRSTGQIRVRINTSSSYYITGTVEKCYASLSRNGTILAEKDLESNQFSYWGQFVDLVAGDVITLKCTNTNNVTKAHTCMFIGKLQIVTPTPSLGTISGGYGGYSSGVLTLTEPTTLYLCPGGKGSSTIYSSKSQAVSGNVNAGGWNGGGSSRVCYTTMTGRFSGTSITITEEALTSAGGGGGASDIRIGSDSLYARVIVAGGGGGASNEDDITEKRGGGLEGAGLTTTGIGAANYKGTQTAAGLNGSFGVGGSVTSTNAAMYCAGGGGGGWYGGGASTGVSDSSSSYNNYNGGGSGYVYTSSTASNYPSGCTLNSAYYLEGASTTTSTHTGNGLIKITCLDVVSTSKIFVKIDSSTWATVDNIFIKTSAGWIGGEN